MPNVGGLLLGSGWVPLTRVCDQVVGGASQFSAGGVEDYVPHNRPPHISYGLSVSQITLDWPLMSIYPWLIKCSSVGSYSLPLCMIWPPCYDSKNSCFVSPGARFLKADLKKNRNIFIYINIYIFMYIYILCGCSPYICA